MTRKSGGDSAAAVKKVQTAGVAVVDADGNFTNDDPLEEIDMAGGLDDAVLTRVSCAACTLGPARKTTVTLETTRNFASTLLKLRSPSFRDDHILLILALPLA